MHLVGHGLAALVALAMGMAGGSKLAGVEMHVENFAKWGYPGFFVYLTGAIEVGGALLLLVPKTRWVGAALLVVTMLAAMATHALFAEWGGLVAPAVLGAMAAGAGWLARPR